ncbi:MAG: hypothetical protein AUF65_01225 [Chloroflexi bacterium 13_1_20CM_50_12]|nr:MAG: hypothetical protein AUF65_01225 [Chloroflexi bacterium 13_1_20CM_50_12]
MIKIPTLFLRNEQNMKLVTREVNPDAIWVFDGKAIPTVKKDGTNIRVTVRNGMCTYAEKRRNPTREEKANGAEPGYVAVDERDPQNQHILSAITHTDYTGWPDGAWPCEALGPKIQGGVEASQPMLYSFVLHPLVIAEPFELTFDGIQRFLTTHAIEGIVWHDENHYRYAKIKRRDFGLPWPVKRG